MMKGKYDFIVYKTTELSTGKIYIGYDSFNRPWYFGSGKYFLNRIYLVIKGYVEETLNEEFIDEKYYSNFYKRYAEHIPYFFKKEILGHYDRMEDMMLSEEYWIEKYNVTDRNIGYNISKYNWGGPVRLNKKNTDIHNKNISNGRKGIIFTDDHRKNIGIATNGRNHCVGRKHRAESNEKNRISHLGKKQSKESIEKRLIHMRKRVYQYDLSNGGILINEYESGKQASELTGLRIHECLIGRTKRVGNYHFSYEKMNSDIVLEKIKRKSSNTRLKIVCQYKLNGIFIKEFKSIIDAENTMNINNIGNCCRGIQKTAGGYIWKFKN